MKRCKSRLGYLEKLLSYLLYWEGSFYSGRGGGGRGKIINWNWQFWFVNTPLWSVLFLLSDIISSLFSAVDVDGIRSLFKSIYGGVPQGSFKSHYFIFFYLKIYPLYRLSPLLRVRILTSLYLSIHKMSPSIVSSQY